MESLSPLAKFILILHFFLKICFFKKSLEIQINGRQFRNIAKYCRGFLSSRWRSYRFEGIQFVNIASK